MKVASIVSCSWTVTLSEQPFSGGQLRTKSSKYRLQSCFPKWASCLGSTSKQYARYTYQVPVSCLANIRVGNLAQASLQSYRSSGGISTGAVGLGHLPPCYRSQSYHIIHLDSLLIERASLLGLAPNAKNRWDGLRKSPGKTWKGCLTSSFWRIAALREPQGLGK